MKLISAAIALLASAAVVSSSPLYNYSDSDITPSFSTPTFDYDNPYSDLPFETPSSMWPDSPFPTGTADVGVHEHEDEDEDDCVGFSITSQTEADIVYSEDSNQEVTFDFTGSKIDFVEYVDLVRYEDKAVVDEWCTGPYYPNNSRTGLHEVHLYQADAGYFQFLVIAATKNDHQCKYYSSKFSIKSNNSTPSQSSESSVAYAAHLQATATPGYDYDDLPDTTTDSSYPTPSSNSYSAHSDSKSSDTDSLVSLFDSIVENLWKLSSEGDGSWQSHIQLIEDDFQKIKTDIETGNTSGDGWIDDVDKLEKDLDYIKTSGTGQWTDHISSLELVLDQLKDGAWDDTFSALVKDLASDGLTLTSSYTTSSSYSTSSYTSTDYPTYAAYYDELSSSSYEEPSSTSDEDEDPAPTPSYYDP